MNRLLTSLTIAGLALAVSACGDYSREDLLFRASVPAPVDVALTPPGAEVQPGGAATSQAQQALSVCGGEGGLRCQAEDVAKGFNNLTFGLLAIIDGVVKLPPTNRELGRRVWGPYFNQAENRTFRFEMLRARDENGELTGQFVHCLFMAQGDASQVGPGDLTCDAESHESGLVRVLHGVFSPGAADGESARSGAGALVLNGNALNALDPTFDIKAVVDIGYDNFSDPSTIGIHIHDVGGEESAIPDEAFYSFEESAAEAGSFVFAIRSDMNPSEGAPGNLELFLIRARWQSDQAGRADAQVMQGDLGDQVWTVTECWDDGLDATYFRDPDPTHPDVGADPNLDCAFAEALPLE